MAAFDLACKLGSGAIELDVQRSADGVLVAFHDATLERVARGPAGACRGRVDDRTFPELRRCDVGSWFNEARPQLARASYARLRIPSLREVLQRYGRVTGLCLELKHPEHAPGIEEQVVAELERGRLGADRVLVQSFSGPSLERVHELAPRLPLHRLFAPASPPWLLRRELELVAGYGAGIGLWRGDVDRELIEAAHRHGLAVGVYTVNEPAELAALVSLGVDGIVTDFPDRLNRVLSGFVSESEQATTLRAWPRSRASGSRLVSAAA